MQIAIENLFIPYTFIHKMKKELQFTSKLTTILENKSLKFVYIGSFLDLVIDSFIIVSAHI